jgi:iron(II)-dependent oxidoreductase
MAGNVREWVADWFSETYYENYPYKNPEGPETGTFRIIRGFDWNNTGSFQRIGFTYTRSSGDHWKYYKREMGFRCARDATP